MSADRPAGRDLGTVDFGRDVPTTAEDVRALRTLKRQTPSWLTLSAEEIDALLPPGALDRRPPTPPGRRPFTLD